MRIAQISPLYERVPPLAYGGTERVVSWLTDELVRRGHDVTLFASGDSQTRARLVPGCTRALRVDQCPDPIGFHVAMIDEVFRRAADGDFDVLHFHTDHLHAPLLERQPHAALTTLHGRIDNTWNQVVFRRFAHHDYVAISARQRAYLPSLSWAAVIHHGMPRDEHPFDARGGDYLAFLGRLSPEKGFEDAVEIARRAGVPLKVAGKIDLVDREYMARVGHLLEEPFVEYVGEIGGAVKDAFVGGARALIFPIDWPEPFGLVMIEAMACGTPVIAYAKGSVPEVIEPGVTGFVVDGIAGAVEAVTRVGALDRVAVRAAFERRFTVERMADDYLRVYDDLIARKDAHGRDAAHHAGSARQRAARRASGT